MKLFFKEDILGYTRKRKEMTFIFRVPEKKRFFFKRGYFRFWKRLETKKETKVKETEMSRSRPKFWERKSRFHYLCLRGPSRGPHQEVRGQRAEGGRTDGSFYSFLVIP